MRKRRRAEKEAEKMDNDEEHPPSVTAMNNFEHVKVPTQT